MTRKRLFLSVLFVYALTAASVFSQSGHVFATSNEYWFQLGVLADTSPANVTGASVQIRTHVPPNVNMANSNLGDTSFWVGLILPNDAFIQVGYASSYQDGGYPQWFWFYYPPNTASQGGGTFLRGTQGDEVGPNATWYTYSIQSGGDVWSAYVDGVEVGSINLDASNSGGNPPYAVAEVEGTYTTHVSLGPVEFRNLQWRDINNQWHSASLALAYVGLGAGSGSLPAGVSNPYGLQVLSANDWVAGSGLPQPSNNQLLWGETQTQPTTSTTQMNYTSYVASTYETSTSEQNMATAGGITTMPTAPLNWRLVILIPALAVAATLFHLTLNSPHRRRAKPKKARLRSR